LFFGAMSAFAVGEVGGYVGRILEQVKRCTYFFPSVVQGKKFAG
jgi:hypothetical protein